MEVVSLASIFPLANYAESAVVPWGTTTFWPAS